MNTSLPSQAAMQAASRSTPSRNVQFRGGAAALFSVALAMSPSATATAAAEPQLTVEQPVWFAISADLAMHYPKVMSRIARFEKLEAGWNGSGSVPPTEIATRAARRVVRELALAIAGGPESKAEPQVAPLDEGGYQFEWRHSDRELFVACNGDGTLSILEAGPGHEKEYSGDFETALAPALRWFTQV